MLRLAWSKYRWWEARKNVPSQWWCQLWMTAHCCHFRLSMKEKPQNYVLTQICSTTRTLLMQECSLSSQKQRRTGQTWRQWKLCWQDPWSLLHGDMDSSQASSIPHSPLVMCCSGLGSTLIQLYSDLMSHPDPTRSSLVIHYQIIHHCPPSLLSYSTILSSTVPYSHYLVVTIVSTRYKYPMYK